MLADALVLRNLLHINMISTRKPGQSITCLSLPEAPGLPVAGVPALAESVLAGRAPGGLWFDLNPGFMAPFGDMTLWNILASSVVVSYIFNTHDVTNLML